MNIGELTFEKLIVLIENVPQYVDFAIEVIIHRRLSYSHLNRYLAQGGASITLVPE